MQKLIFVLLSLLAITNTANAQTNLPYGDTARARRSAHAPDPAAAEDPLVRIGYIDIGTTASATLQQFIDNLQVGLRIVRVTNHKVVSFKITIFPKGGDIRSSHVIKDNKISTEVFNELNIRSLKSGDVILFEDIRVLNDQNRTRTMNEIRITIK